MSFPQTPEEGGRQLSLGGAGQRVGSQPAFVISGVFPLSREMKIRFSLMPGGRLALARRAGGSDLLTRRRASREVRLRSKLRACFCVALRSACSQPR